MAEKVLKASPAETRKMLEVVEVFKKAGMRFVPIPALNDEDFNNLIQQLQTKIAQLEGLVE